MQRGLPPRKRLSGEGGRRLQACTRRRAWELDGQDTPVYGALYKGRCQFRCVLYLISLYCRAIYQCHQRRCTIFDNNSARWGVYILAAWRGGGSMIPVYQEREYIVPLSKDDSRMGAHHRSDCLYGSVSARYLLQWCFLHLRKAPLSLTTEVTRIYSRLVHGPSLLLLVSSPFHIFFLVLFTLFLLPSIPWLTNTHADGGETFNFSRSCYSGKTKYQVALPRRNNV